MTARRKTPGRAEPKPKAGAKAQPRRAPRPKPPPAGPMSRAFATTVMALYADDRIDATHEAAVTQGALLAGLLDAAPRHDSAPKWMTEYRQVWRALMGEPVDGGQDNSPASAFIAELAALRHGRTPAA